MDSIKAFVGHSFASDDSSVVGKFLAYLTGIAEIHPSFSWEHAEHAEPKGIDAKVLEYFADKNLFIGICTRKERVVAAADLRSSFFHKRLSGPPDAFAWKTSDWILQEIGLSVGRGLHVIVLLEDGVRGPGTIQGTLEYIPFMREAPEGCFGKLLQMIGAISGKPSCANAVEAQNPLNTEGTQQSASAEKFGVDWDVPDATWSVRQFEMAYWHNVMLDDEDRRQQIDIAFRASALGENELSRLQWRSWMQLCKLRFGRGGSLLELKRLTNEVPTDSLLWDRLGDANTALNEPSAASDAFEKAAGAAETSTQKVRLLGKAAVASSGAGNELRSTALAQMMRSLSRDASAAEAEFLSAEGTLAEARKDDAVQVAAMERRLALDPSDTETRFSVAYKYSQLGLSDMAAFHYSRVPSGSRTGIVWNNLGVALDRLDLPAKAVHAYQRAQGMSETLATSNLALKLLDSGFISEATKALEDAAQLPDHHRNIDTFLARAKGAVEAEEEKERTGLARAQSVSDFYREFGAALAMPMDQLLEGQWTGPVCSLQFLLQGDVVTATGMYEASGLGLFGLATLGLGANSPPSPTQWVVEYIGRVRGRAMQATLTVRKEGEPVKGRSLLVEGSPKAAVLMCLVDDGSKLRVMEREGTAEPKFYAIRREG